MFLQIVKQTNFSPRYQNILRRIKTSARVISAAKNLTSCRVEKSETYLGQARTLLLENASLKNQRKIFAEIEIEKKINKKSSLKNFKQEGETMKSRAV